MSKAIFTRCFSNFIAGKFFVEYKISTVIIKQLFSCVFFFSKSTNIFRNLLLLQDYYYYRLLFVFHLLLSLKIIIFYIFFYIKIICIYKWFFVFIIYNCFFFILNFQIKVIFLKVLCFEKAKIGLTEISL